MMDQGGSSKNVSESNPMSLAEQGKTYRSNIIVTSFIEIATIVIRTIIGVIIARILGPAGRGEYALALLIPGLFITVTSLGFGEASATLIGKEKYDKEKVVGCLMTYVTFVTLIVGILYYSFQSAIISLVQHGISTHVYCLSFILVPLQLFWGSISSILLGLGIIKKISYGRFFNNFLFFLAIVSVASLYRLTPFIALFFFICTWIAEIVYLHRCLRKHIKLTLSFDRRILKEQFNFGIRLFWNSIFLQLNRRLDSYILTFFKGNYSLGIYTVAVGLCEFILTIPTVFTRVAFSFSVRANTPESLRITTVSIRQITFLLLTSTLILAVCMKPLILLFYSSTYIEALRPALLLLPGIISLGLSSMLGTILVGQSKPQDQTIASGLSCAVTVLLDLILIPKYGISGAAVASTIAYTISAIYLIRVYKNLSHATLADMLVIKKEDILDYHKDIVRRIRTLLGKSNIS
ncbi:MAG: oligosaccharide flippase family protein [Syntrophales bacterium]